MAWSRPGDKPFSEPMMVSLPTHIYVTRPQCVNIVVLLRTCILFISVFVLSGRVVFHFDHVCTYEVFHFM